MGRVIKIVGILVLLGLGGLALYALVSDLPPPTREVVRPLPLPGTGGMRDQ